MTCLFERIFFLFQTMRRTKSSEEIKKKERKEKIKTKNEIKEKNRKKKTGGSSSISYTCNLSLKLYFFSSETNMTCHSVLLRFAVYFIQETPQEESYEYIEDKI